MSDFITTVVLAALGVTLMEVSVEQHRKLPFGYKVAPQLNMPATDWDRDIYRRYGPCTFEDRFNEIGIRQTFDVIVGVPTLARPGCQRDGEKFNGR